MTVKELKGILENLPDNAMVAYSLYEDENDPKWMLFDGPIWLSIDGYKYDEQDKMLILTYDGWE